MIEIDRNSPAFAQLAEVLADPLVTMVRIDVREDGIAVKVNESVWSPTLRTNRRA